MALTENARGAVVMAAAMAAFSSNDALMKLVFQTLPVGQGMVLRGLGSALFLLLLLRLTVGFARWRDLGHRAVLFRTVADGLAAAAFLTALSQISIATLTSMLQITPLLATALAATLLGEPVGWRRWLATGVGLAGVLMVILAGGGEGLSLGNLWAPGALLGLAAAALAAARDVSTRRAPPETPALMLALAVIIGNILIGAALSLGESWRPVSDLDALRLVIAAGVVGVAHMLIGMAMRLGDISVVSPVRYLIVLFAGFWAWAFFDETPRPLALIGVAIVIAAGLYTLRRERARGVRVTPTTGLRGAAPPRTVTRTPPDAGD